MSDFDDTDEDAAPADSSGNFLALLTLVFLVLKLTGVIGWSWWWVFSPLWLPAALVIAIIAAALGVLLVVAVFAVLFNR